MASHNQTINRIRAELAAALHARNAEIVAMRDDRVPITHIANAAELRRDEVYEILGYKRPPR